MADDTTNIMLLPILVGLCLTGSNIHTARGLYSYCRTAIIVYPLIVNIEKYIFMIVFVVAAAADVRDHVALLGSNISFVCVANITANFSSSTGIEPLGIVINNRHLLTSTDAHSISEIYGNKNFTWTFFERNSRKIGKLYILASEQNNETTVLCITNGKLTQEERIIVVEGMLINGMIMEAAWYITIIILLVFLL